MTISEMKKELKGGPNPQFCSWLEIWSILRRNKLLRRRSRFRYYRRR